PRDRARTPRPWHRNAGRSARERAAVRPDIRSPPAARSRAGFDCRCRHCASRLSPAQPTSGIIIYGARLGKKVANANQAPLAKNRLAQIGQLRLNAADSPRGMSMTRSRFLHVAAAAVGILAAPGAAPAQAYPTRPIQVIVPFAGGSASDVVTRILLDRMAKSLGQPFVVDNRPGAGGNIGTNAATKATPDGYTLVMGSTGPMAANRTLYRDLGYDPEKDLEPISLFAHFPILIVVSSKLSVKSVTEFVAYAKARPKQLNYGSVGIGSSQHLAGVYFEQVTGLELTHVPYRNIAQY